MVYNYERYGQEQTFEGNHSLVDRELSASIPVVLEDAHEERVEVVNLPSRRSRRCMTEVQAGKNLLESLVTHHLNNVGIGSHSSPKTFPAEGALKPGEHENTKELWVCERQRSRKHALSISSGVGSSHVDVNFSREDLLSC